jgi:hypothetical protein
MPGRVTKAQAADMPANYHAWAGDADLPLGLGHHEVVEVWFRMGRSSVRPRPAHVWRWRHCDSSGDIMGWRRFAQGEVG